ncbi:MAG: HEAT repeat domain-containing protein [Phycisphaerae bacterium]
MNLNEVRTLITQLHERMSPQVIEAIEREIVRLGPDALRVILFFPEALVHPPARRRLARLATEMDHAKVLPVLVEALSHPDWRIFQITADALALMGAEPRDALAANLRDCQSAVGRAHTLFCIHRLADPFHWLGIGDRTLVPLIAGAAGDESAEVRATAVESLSKCEALAGRDEAQAEAYARAVTAALDDADETVREQAVKACGRMFDARCGDALSRPAVDRLILMLPAVAGEARADAVRALERIGDIRAAGAVRAMLGDRDPYVRWSAAVALRRLWEMGNATALAAAVNDPDPVVAAAARETLAQCQIRNS